MAIYATEYIKIRIWAAPCHFIIIWIKWMVSGDAKCQSTNGYNSVLNLTNLLLNILFVVLDWKVAGVALGSVIASYLGLVLALSIFFSSTQNIGNRDGGKNGERAIFGNYQPGKNGLA